MDDDIRTLDGEEFKMGMYRDLELLMSSVMGYENELNDSVSSSQKNANFCELMDQGAICGPDGKRIPARKGASPAERAEFLSTILMSGRPLFVYKKGEVYPRQVVYNPSTGRVETQAQPIPQEQPEPQGPKPGALSMAWNRFRARHGHTPSENFLAWQRYEDWKVAKKNVMDERRIRRRRRNDAILSSGYQNVGLNSGRNRNKHIAQTFISALKGPLGFGAELGAKGRRGLDELLTDGSIVNAYGKPICASRPGSRAAQYEAIGNWFRDTKQALYIYKPGEKYPHEMFLDAAGRLRISKETIDKIPNENIRKPNFWERLLDQFGQRNPAAFRHGRMLNRQYLMRQAETAEWQRNREALDKKHHLHPIQTDKSREELKRAVEQKKQREAQPVQPAPEKKAEQPEIAARQAQMQQPKAAEPQPQQAQPKSLTLEEQLAALQAQTSQMLERMRALEAQIRQQNQPVSAEPQPVKEEKAPVKEEVKPAAQPQGSKKGWDLSIGSGGTVQLDGVEKQPQGPKPGWDLSIGTGGTVQLDGVEKQPLQTKSSWELSVDNGGKVQLDAVDTEPEERLEAPKVRGEGDGIEFDPATGEYVRFDKFSMSAPEEWAERYRIRMGQEPSEAELNAIYRLGDTSAGWVGIRQEMAEQQEKLSFRLENEQEAYESQQIRLEARGQKEAESTEPSPTEQQVSAQSVVISVKPTRTNPVLEAPDQLLRRLNQEFPGRVTERMQKNILEMHERACDSYDSLEKACASQPKGSKTLVSGKKQARDVISYNYFTQSLNIGQLDEKDLVMLGSDSYQAIEDQLMDGASRSAGFFQNPQRPEVFQRHVLKRSGLEGVTSVYMTEKRNALNGQQLESSEKFRGYVDRYEKKMLQKNEPGRRRAHTVAARTESKKPEPRQRTGASMMK